MTHDSILFIVSKKMESETRVIVDSNNREWMIKSHESRLVKLIELLVIFSRLLASMMTLVIGKELLRSHDS